MALITSTTVAAQGDVYKRSQSYEWPTDPLVVRKLKQWQDLKFGVLTGNSGIMVYLR